MKIKLRIYSEKFRVFKEELGALYVQHILPA